MIAIYCRVSSVTQAKEGTIQSQIDYATKYCDLNQLEARFYLDDGITGTIPLSDRPAGQVLLADATNHLFTDVYIYKIDRLGRSTRIILEAIHQLEQLGVHVKSMTEPFDTSTPSGRFMLTMLAGVADLERSNILERLALGKLKAVNDGKWVRSNPPYGYDLVPKPVNKLVINEREAENVRLIYKLYTVDKLSSKQITERLNILNIPSPRLKCLSADRKLYHGWNRTMVKKILSARTYIGIFDDAVYGEIPVPPIIEPETFNMATDMRRNNTHIIPRNVKGQYLLRGLLVCNRCGHRYIGVQGKNLRYYAYSFTKEPPTKADKCKGRYRRIEEVEEYIWNDLTSSILGTNGIHPTEHKQQDDPRAQIIQEIKKCDTEREKILDLYRLNIVSLPDLQNQFSKIDNKKNELEHMLDSIVEPKPKSDMRAVRPHIVDILQASDINFETRRKVIELCIDNIVIDDDDIKISYRF